MKRDTLTADLLDRLGKLDRMAAERGQSLAQMALAWVLKDSKVTSVIVGASSIGQLDNSIKAIENTSFSTDELTLINELTR